MRRAVALVALVVLTALAYWNAFGNPFVYDDVHVIVNNAWLRDRRWLGTLLAARAMTPSGDFPHFRPLVLATLFSDWQLGGGAPLSFRLTSLAIHCADGVLALFVVRRFVRLFHDDPVADRAALVAAAIFLLHPISGAAIHLAVKRSSSLATLGILAALLCWARAADARRSLGARLLGHAGAIAFGALALLAKEDGLVLPALVCVYELARRRPIRSFALGVASLLVVPGLYLLFWFPRGAMFSTQPAKCLGYLLSQPLAVGLYARMLVDPGAIAVAYDLEYPLSWARLVPLAAVALAVATVLYARRRVPLVAAAVAWAAIVLAPASSILPTNTPVDEVRCYGGFLLLYGVIGVGVTWLSDAIRRRAAGLATAGFLAAAPLLIVCALMAAASLRENARWADPVALYTHAVERYPRSRLGNADLCAYLERSGLLDRAIPQCERAIRLAPEDPYPRCVLVEALARTGNVDRAGAVLAQARGAIGDALPIVLCDASLAWFKDDLARARRLFEQVLLRDPQNDTARVYLADVLERQGDRARAAELLHSFDAAPPPSQQQRQLLSELALRLRR